MTRTESRGLRKAGYVLRYLLLAGICGAIFYFSSNNGNDSTDQSSRIVRFLARVFDIDLSGLSYDPYTQAMYSFIELAVRKLAHFAEYALLGALSYYAFFPVKNRGLRFLFALLFSTLYACTDELHQTFVAERTGTLRDVIIDSAGAAAGAFFMLVMSVFVLALGYVRRAEQEELSGPPS